MRLQGLCGRAKGRFLVCTTDSHHYQPIAPNRLSPRRAILKNMKFDYAAKLSWEREYNCRQLHQYQNQRKEYYEHKILRRF
jgi:hypothetical protein